VANPERHAARTQHAQALGPEGFGLGRPDVEAQLFSPLGGIDLTATIAVSETPRRSDAPFT
jgi:hypothetical protein